MNKLQNTRQSCVNFPQIACWGKLHVLFKWSPQLQKSERLIIFIPPTVSIRSRSLKTARSERQSGIAWVSAEGKRQVRVSFGGKKKKTTQTPKPYTTAVTDSTNTVTDTDTEGEQGGRWVWSESDFGKHGNGSQTAGIRWIWRRERLPPETEKPLRGDGWDLLTPPSWMSGWHRTLLGSWIHPV